MKNKSKFKTLKNGISQPNRLESRVWSLESAICSVDTGVYNVETGVWSLESGDWSLENQLNQLLMTHCQLMLNLVAKTGQI